jgi:hypothetical protein
MSLLTLDREVADYFIVHELLHFFVPNHGKLWKSLMRAHLGDYETLASRLPVQERRDRSAGKAAQGQKRVHSKPQYLARRSNGKGFPDLLVAGELHGFREVLTCLFLRESFSPCRHSQMLVMNASPNWLQISA